MANHPEWLKRFADQVLTSVSTLASPGEFSCHSFYNNRECEWEVTLFAQPSFGGRLSPLNCSCPLGVDVLELASCFDAVAACGWQSALLGDGDDIGSHISVEGEYQGHRVWLRIPGQPPAQIVGADECFSIGDSISLN